MGKRKVTFKNFQNLRKQAEGTLAEDLLDLPDHLPHTQSLSLEDTKRMIHELRVHQIELELQNEELKLAQLEQEKSYARFYELYHSAPFGYLTLDEHYRIQETNLKGAQLLGSEKNLLLKQPLHQFVFSEDQDILYLCLRHLKEKEQNSCELRMVQKDNSIFWAQIEITKVHDSGVEPHEFRAVIMDVSERKHAEELVQNYHYELEERVKTRTLELEEASYKSHKSEEQFKKMVELLPISIFCHGKKDVVFANSEASNLIDMSSQQNLTGQSIVRFLHPKEKRPFIHQFMQVLTEEVSVHSFPARIVQVTGTVIDVEMSLTPFIYQGDPSVLIAAYNVTQRKKNEEEMFKAEKLKSISILAGGIAHDFNNYLTVLLGNISMAMSNQNDPDKTYKFVEAAKEAALQTKDLASQLLVFSKGGEPVKELVDMHQLIMECTHFALSGSNVSHHFTIDEDLYQVEIDKGQFTQVLSNIIINSVQALSEGGSIHIQARNTWFEPEEDNTIPLPEGEYVQVSISDNGPGIPEDSLLKIFDPFYTTKENGNGLGLAGAYTIVKNHNGYIKAESEFGKGTTLSFMIPASYENHEDFIKNENIIYGTGKILVMDDEKSIRKVIGQMLNFMGYETHFARDGNEAIDLYFRAKESGQPFDLVILDMTVRGGKGGKTTIKELLLKDPEAKAIVASGYSKNHVISEFKKYGFKGVAKKPFSIDELSKIIDVVLS